MLDPNLLRKEINIVSKNLSYRKVFLDVENFKKKENKRKILQVKKENLQFERNYKSKIISKKKDKENIDFLKKEVIQIGKQIDIVKIELEILQKKIKNYILSLPNIIDEKVPIGYSKKDNVEILRWGKKIEFNFPIRDHVELGKIRSGLDFDSAVKLTGSRFVVIKGNYALLHRALVQFMLDLHIKKYGYEEYYLPYLVNHSSLYGTGQLPKFSNDLFHVQSFDKKSKNVTYALIPTAEVPLMNLMRDKIIEESKLPIKMTAHTPCFRSEAGSYGRDTRGMIRMHQFDKVEIVQIVKPENSMKILEDMTNQVETVLKLLNLPYRKMLLCSGEIGFSACKTYDLEVWIPSEKKYCEISSCSNVGDFQARRMKIRYREKANKKIKLVHTLNASGLAIGRTFLAILENYQQKDGSIAIPSVLKYYMKDLVYI